MSGQFFNSATSRLKRNWVWVVLALVVTFFFYLGFRPPTQLVDTNEVRRALFEQTISEEGKTRVKDRYVVTAPVSGYLERVLLEAGDRVNSAEPLFTVSANAVALLDNRTKAQAEANLAAAESALKTAQAAADAEQARLQFAQAEFQRLQTIAKQGFVAADRLDQAAAHLRTAQAAMRSAEFQVQTARHQRDNAQYWLRSFAQANGEAIKIQSPVNGVILKRYRESAGVINAGEPVLEIADTRSLEIEVDVLSADAVRVQPGMQVRIEHWGGDNSLLGTVARIEPAGFTKYSALGVEEQRVWVIVDFAQPENPIPDNLGDGYRVEATFIMWQADNLLQAPSNALIHEGEEIFVYRVADGRAHKIPIKIGRRSGLWVEVLEGVTEGDRLVSHPDENIEEGVRIELR